MQEKLIIITGGAGFIGSALIRFLNDQGKENIVVVDRLGKSEKWKNLVGKRFFHLLEADSLFGWLGGREKEIEAFVHLGACSDTTESDAAFLLKNNYQFTIELAQYALRHQHCFIYASSAATYGDGSLGFSDAHDLIDHLQPLNMYGYSKQLVDQWFLRRKSLDQVVGLKYFNVFGPNEYHKGYMASALYKLFPLAKEGKALSLFRSSDRERYGDGEQKRDFLYIRDAVRMTAAFLDNRAGGIVNIGSGTPTTWNDLARALFSAVGRPPRIEYIDMPTSLLGKYQNYTCAERSKTRQFLGKNAETTPFSEAVEEYVQNYLIPGKRW